MICQAAEGPGPCKLCDGMLGKPPSRSAESHVSKACELGLGGQYAEHADTL